MRPATRAADAGEAAVGVGDRVLARLVRDEDGAYEARVVKRLGQSAHRILGVFREMKDERGRKFGGGRVEPADRKARHDIVIEAQNVGEAKNGDLVFVEIDARQRERARAQARHHQGSDRHRARSARGLDPGHARTASCRASADEEAQAKAAQKPTLTGRTDLRKRR
ncbi:MAG: hypothetical protein R3C16_02770 [Hyphomonadaceae bacterium]